MPCAAASAAIIRGEERVAGEVGPDGDGPLRGGSAGRRGRAPPGWRRAAMPSPSQTGHQPSGLLNEKWCGDSSLEAAAAAVAGAVLAVAVDRPARLVGLVADPGDVHHALAQVERRLDRVGEPRPGRPADDRAVDHHLDLVLAAVAQLGRLVEADRLAVDPHPREARGRAARPRASRSVSPSRRSTGAIT